MSELPLELWLAIIDEVDDRSDLVQLLLVSRNFNSVVERRLYHRISTYGRSPGAAVIKRKWGVFERISTCPRVAAHVFNLSIGPDLPSPNASSILAKVFLSVPNLKILHIHASSDLQRHFPTRVPFLLRTFSCFGTQYDEQFTHTLETFLEAQVELKELQSDCEMSLTSSALPKLVTVTSSAKFIRKILPGRPVTQITVLGGGLESPPSCEAACSIRSLRLTLNDLKYYTTFFPILTFLEYTTHTYNFAAIDPFLGSHSALKKLKIMVVTVRSQDAKYMEGVSVERLNLVNSAFAACPSLYYIQTRDYYDRQFISNDINSLVWTRESQTGIASLWDVGEWKRW